ncbi:MAG: glycosyl hydrolase family protein, partial [Armatimonadetes bacterium]|nr:glycosyl hydrolase family protein [Armatimonadota bacterium]
EFQASNPAQALRLPSLHAFQIDSSGEIGPAKLWIDDLVARNVHNAGGPFVAGPLDEEVRRLPAARGLPRLGTWGMPPLTAEGIARCKALGLGFASQGEPRRRQQLAFVQGLVSNVSPGRPGAEALAGLNLTDEDFDQDAQGNRMGEGIQSAVFLPEVVERFYAFTGEAVRARRDAPWVGGFMLSSPVSMYGEVHYSASTTGQYAVFSRPAKANFRAWLRRRYGDDLTALSRAWEQSIVAWEAVEPPLGPQDGPEGIDRRTCWSDFMHWYNGWLEEVTRESLLAARKETDKPLGVIMGGPKIGLSQGIALGNIGPIVKVLGQTGPAFFNDTDSQTLFSCRYSRTACSQYGVDLMLEHVGPPYLHLYHQYNMALNVPACGADAAHLAHWGELYDAESWFGRTWAGLGPLVCRYRTGYVRSEAALFHSYLTSWYRPSRSNGDCVRLYDSTNQLWYADKGFPSWGRALAAPDVLDDVMIEDGGLAGRKLLVIPNSSVTVTSRKAVEALRRWVKAGGTLIGFGPGCLAYTVEGDRSITATPGLAGLIPEPAVEEARTRTGSDPLGRLEEPLGRGRAILYLHPADDAFVMEQGVGFLREEAERAKVGRWCWCEGPDANVMYAGRDRLSGKHLFVADFTRTVRWEKPESEPLFWADCVANLGFHPSLTGEAELVGLTDSFDSCEGGAAEYDPTSRVLTVSFKLPGVLALTFGRNRS